jgi:hypothetical protein
VDDEIAELFLEEIVPDAMQLHAAIRRAVIAEKFVSGITSLSCLAVLEPFSTCSNFLVSGHWQGLFWGCATETTTEKGTVCNAHKRGSGVGCSKLNLAM